MKLIIRCFFLSCLFALTACATVPRERVFDDFVIVKAEDADDFSSLAANYLNNREKAWQIAEFNNLTSVKPGQELVIPLSPFNRGGLKADGCQTVRLKGLRGITSSWPGLTEVRLLNSAICHAFSRLFK